MPVYIKLADCLCCMCIHVAVLLRGHWTCLVFSWLIFGQVQFIVGIDSVLVFFKSGNLLELHIGICAKKFEKCK